ncbi:uncharacterized protein BDR25DRAFT_243041 [Lindgomyces ingoldianus]|uniref:Uncharacterized protein n=1 Tax=Lindgomyces ingoldianus TaxID=673940 RepID=A0ACB6QBI3_9PLEO|nr:uncharacterized protein BDR25DRAFT_243041 [Lindgomyces ingoldianus]KAF2464323.1 hypothetical protein BDR25DRAFT_243041 [Lindgomyces ingoldianus]
MGHLPIFLSNALLSALSIANLGLISSMVGFLHDQKDNVGTYRVDWPGETVQLKVLPKHLWVDQGHTSNGVAGYGFFLGLFGLYVAWRQRRREGRNPSKTLLTLSILQFLAVLFTLSAIIFVFLVTNQTKGQSISEDLARSNVDYSADKWTPETWFKAVLDLPLADQHQHDKIDSKVTNMVAWRWMLIPIFLVDILAFGISTIEMIKQRKGAKEPGYSPEK